MLQMSALERLRIERDELAEENRQLREQLSGAREVERTRARRLFGISKNQAIVLCYLVNCGFAARDGLIDAIWGDEYPENPDNTLGCALKRLRKALAPHGIVVTNIYGEGYAMSEDDRARCRKILWGSA